MARLLRNTFLLIICTAITFSCAENNEPIKLSDHNSIYYWKTTFKIDSADQKFLDRHKIDRIYLRMFDIVSEYYRTDSIKSVPHATTIFNSPIPENIEIVPVTYITVEGLRNMHGYETEYAKLITSRIKAICNHNNCGKIKELQLDCDWTSTTKEIYESLCQHIQESLSKDSIALSITVRLHQLNETPPPCDKGVLMLYNTGALKNFNTQNSILDIDNVEPYVKKYNGTYPIPLDFAYPTFGWGVKFANGEFQGIVSENATTEADNEKIRRERPKFKEIIKVKRLVEKHIGKPATANILYHLDQPQLENYTENEINKILAR